MQRTACQSHFRKTEDGTTENGRRDRAEALDYMPVHRMSNNQVLKLCCNLNGIAKTAGPVFDHKAGIFDRRVFQSEFFFQ